MLLSLKGEETLTQAAAWMPLKDATLREASQPQRRSLEGLTRRHREWAGPGLGPWGEDSECPVGME